MFNIDTGCKNGHRKTCKACHGEMREARSKTEYGKISTKKSREKRKDKKKEYMAEYHKKYISIPENRERTLKNSAIWQKNNRDRINELARKRYAINPISRAEQMRDRRKEYPDSFRLIKARRRAQKKACSCAIFTVENWNYSIFLFDGRCAYCGKKYEKLTIDHVVPLVSGGKHTADNIVPACAKCNSSKNAKSLLRFLVDRSNLLQLQTKQQEQL